MEKYIKLLKQIKKEAEEIQALWNGEGTGKQEENAHIAEEISDKCSDIIYLISTLN